MNNINMANATHAEAVAALKSITSSCHLVVSREVLVVLPSEDIPEKEEEKEEEGDKTEPTPALPVLDDSKMTASDVAVTSGGEVTGGEVTGGEVASVEEGALGEGLAAKKIVEEVIDKSVKRYVY